MPAVESLDVLAGRPSCFISEASVATHVPHANAMISALPDGRDSGSGRSLDGHDAALSCAAACASSLELPRTNVSKVNAGLRLPNCWDVRDG